MENIYLVSRTLNNMKNEIIKKNNRIEISKDPFYQIKKTCKLLNDIDEMALKMYNNHLENGCLMGDLLQYKCWISKACKPFNG